MATTDVDWLATRNQIIEQALSHIGVIELGEDPSPEQFARALFQLNSVTKFLETKHLFLWNYSEETIATVAGTASYTFTNSDAIGIDEAYYLSSGQKINLDVIDMADYRAISDKTTAGTPAQVAFDRGSVTPTIYLYPVPDAIISLKVRVARRLKDWDTAAGNAWPAWWVEPLVWRMAADLSHMFRLPLPERQLLEAKAADLMREAFIDDFRTHDQGEVIFNAE